MKRLVTRPSCTQSSRASSKETCRPAPAPPSRECYRSLADRPVVEPLERSRWKKEHGRGSIASRLDSECSVGRDRNGTGHDCAFQRAIRIDSLDAIRFPVYRPTIGAVRMDGPTRTNVDAQSRGGFRGKGFWGLMWETGRKSRWLVVKSSVSFRLKKEFVAALNC